MGSHLRIVLSLSPSLQLTVSCHPRSQFAAYSDQPHNFLKIVAKAPIFQDRLMASSRSAGKPPCAMQGGIPPCSPRLSPQGNMARGVTTATP